MLARTNVFATDCLDDFIRRSSKKLCNDRELIDVIFPWEKRFTLKHLCKDTACAPDVYLHVVFLPREHDFRSAVISRRNIASHLRVLDSCEPKITNLEVTILIDKDIAWLQISVNDAGRMYIF